MPHPLPFGYSDAGRLGAAASPTPRYEYKTFKVASRFEKTDWVRHLGNGIRRTNSRSAIAPITFTPDPNTENRKVRLTMSRQPLRKKTPVRSGGPGPVRSGGPGPGPVRPTMMSPTGFWGLDSLTPATPSPRRQLPAAPQGSALKRTASLPKTPVAALDTFEWDDLGTDLKIPSDSAAFQGLLGHRGRTASSESLPTSAFKLMDDLSPAAVRPGSAVSLEFEAAGFDGRPQTEPPGGTNHDSPMHDQAHFDHTAWGTEDMDESCMVDISVKELPWRRRAGKEPASASEASPQDSHVAVEIEPGAELEPPPRILRTGARRLMPRPPATPKDAGHAATGGQTDDADSESSPSPRPPPGSGKISGRRPPKRDSRISEGRRLLRKLRGKASKLGTSVFGSSPGTDSTSTPSSTPSSTPGSADLHRGAAAIQRGRRGEPCIERMAAIDLGDVSIVMPEGGWYGGYGVPDQLSGRAATESAGSSRSPDLPGPGPEPEPEPEPLDAAQAIALDDILIGVATGAVAHGGPAVSLQRTGSGRRTTML